MSKLKMFLASDESGLMLFSSALVCPAMSAIGIWVKLFFGACFFSWLLKRLESK